MDSKETSKKHFYLKWPWNVIVYIILVVVFRVFAIPVILLLVWWNKKQQPDGPEDGYCLERTRGRLIGLIPAAAFGGGGALALWFFYLGQTLPEEVERLDDKMRIFYYLCPFLGTGAVLIGIFLAYRSLRDALYPEKSALAQSIRDQLRYPDEAPPVKELFAMVDQDLKQNGQWCGKMGIGKEWVLGDVVSAISRIRGVFSRVERHTHHAGQRTRVTYTYEIWIVDDRQQRQVTSFKSEKQLEEAIDCLRHRAPAAVFGRYDSKEYNDLVNTKEEMEQYLQERAYQQRKAQLEQQERQQQERLAQNQVLTFPRWFCYIPYYLGYHPPAAAQSQPDGRGQPISVGAGYSFPGTGACRQPSCLHSRRRDGADAHPAGGVFRYSRQTWPVCLVARCLLQ